MGFYHQFYHIKLSFLASIMKRSFPYHWRFLRSCTFIRFLGVTFTWFQSLRICDIVKMWILFFICWLASFQSCQVQARPQDYGEEYFYQEYDEDYDMYYNYDNYDDDGLEEETDEDAYIRNTTPSTTTTTTTTTTSRARTTRRPYYYTTR